MNDDHDVSALFSSSDDGILVVKAVALPGERGAYDITIAAGRIASITARPGTAPGWVSLPPLADLHVHANRAFSIGDRFARSFDDAVAMTRTLFSDMDEDYCRRASLALFEQSLSKGTSKLRTHADISSELGLMAVEGTLAAARAVADCLAVEVVAFGSLDPSEAPDRLLLRTAIEKGAHYLGGVPLLCRSPGRAIDALLDLAKDMNVPVDLHLDEHLDAANCWSGYLADAVMKRGLEGRVTLSHGCAIAALPEREAAIVIKNLAIAGITVVVLPTTNLYLQDRGRGTPLRRGITRVHDMLDAGVEVYFASDNVQDAFYPYGNADLLDIALLAATVIHVESPRHIIAGITGGCSSLAIGDEASMLLVEGQSLSEIMAKRPAQRIMMRKGRILSR